MNLETFPPIHHTKASMLSLFKLANPLLVKFDAQTFSLYLPLKLSLSDRKAAIAACQTQHKFTLARQSDDGRSADFKLG
jgi:hypothetical protein